MRRLIPYVGYDKEEERLSDYNRNKHFQRPGPKIEHEINSIAAIALKSLGIPAREIGKLIAAAQGRQMPYNSDSISRNIANFKKLTGQST